MVIRNVLLCLTLIFSSAQLPAQTSEKVDSLLTLLSSTETDEVFHVNVALAFEYSGLGNYAQAIEHMYRAKAFAEKTNNNKLKALAYFDLGKIYLRWDNYKQSAFYLNKSLITPNGLDSADMVHANVMIGIDYSSIDLDSTAIVYYKTALSIAKPKRSHGFKYDHIYNNIGIAFMDLGFLDSAKFYHDSSLTLRLANSNMSDVGQSYNNIGSLKYELEEFDSALYYYEKGLEYRIKGNLKWSGIIESRLNIAKALIELEKYSEANSILEKAYDTLTRSRNIPLNIRAARFLEQLHNKKGNFKDALKFNRVLHHYQDSLSTMGQNEQMMRLLSVSKYQNKLFQDSIQQAEKDRTMLLEEEQRQRTNEVIFTAFISVVLLLLGIVVLIYRNLRSKKRAAIIITEQKHEVELQRDIARKRQQDAEDHQKTVQHQKDLLSDRNREITDSITYAKQIQLAILPGTIKFTEFFEDSLVLYRPRDIVAGDFIWLETINNHSFIAVADCTGHGVPGALVSLVCYGALNRCIHEFGLKQPAKILAKARDIIVDNLSNSEKRMTDGMDVSLLVIDNSSKLHWSGANNPLWIIQKEQHEILEYRGDDQPVGNYIAQDDFTNHEIVLKEGDTFYMVTDGFQDQFGGEKDKKFGSTRLKRLLSDMQHLSLPDQKTELDRALNEWMGSNKQIDDITILGFKFKRNLLN